MEVEEKRKKPYNEYIKKKGNETVLVKTPAIEPFITVVCPGMEERKNLNSF